MPGLNQRGPEGQGPMTGRRMGKCTNFGAKITSRPSGGIGDNDSRQEEAGTEDMTPRGYGYGYGGRGFGRGRGSRGPGRGMGRQNRFRGSF